MGNFRDKTIEWPKRFVFVTSTGAAAIVNRVPLQSAGRDRIAAVILMVAVSRPDELRQTPSDTMNALAPRDRFVAELRDDYRFSDEDIHIVVGHQDDFAAWYNVLTQASQLAETLDAEVIFNISAGRTSCRIAPLLGFTRDQAMVRMSLLAVGQSPFSMSLISWPHAGEPEQAFLPIEHVVSITDYLAGYGLIEIDSGEREDLEGKMERYGELATRYLPDDVESYVKIRDALGYLGLELNKANGRRQHRVPVEAGLAEWAVKTLRKYNLFEGLPGIALNGTQLFVRDDFSYRFITGGWLECLIRREVKSALGNLDGYELASSYRVAVSPRKQQLKESTEFDLILLEGERLTLVEAKAIGKPQGLHTTTAKLAQYGRQLAGSAGRSLLVCPYIERDELEKVGLLEHAESVGVQLYSGQDAVKRMKSALRPGKH